ncbi:proteasome assembly chaperone family protein [Halodesulfurarchaeum sp. HSR-GB]|uniref:proteasome assembly chaperone family protein n=1 Tax=Halodesulfurarchaeum sp. HSR-GB TaxID=3074077 RepID=UPI00285ECC72|nr:proteasome assembly chaperone family protein [Halodesulfurarchaeum sp. HSR-GB]MDR5657251.1 proteasome assembly chaperone family protein [Halodesulfurarchaeum sp. HSR-GB]
MGTVVLDQELDLDRPTLIEGLPGVGLVGKIATDHLIEELDMDEVGYVDCDGLPKIAIYGDGKHAVTSPVRLYADEKRDLLALQSDIPVSRQAAPGFAEILVDWVVEVDALPLFLSGLPQEETDPTVQPSLFGVASGEAETHLTANDIDPPDERGAIGGPTGALMNRTSHTDVDACGLIVESDPQFPDPAAAQTLITRGIEPIADVSVPTEDLVERAEDIREQKETLAKRMQQAGEEESTQAQPLRMYQ